MGGICPWPGENGIRGSFEITWAKTAFIFFVKSVRYRFKREQQCWRTGCLGKQNSCPAVQRVPVHVMSPPSHTPHFTSKPQRVLSGRGYSLSSQSPFSSLCHDHRSSQGTYRVEHGAWHPAISTVWVIAVGSYSGETSPGSVIHHPNRYPSKSTFC